MLRVTTCEHSHFTDEEKKYLKRTAFSEDPLLTQRELGFNGRPCYGQNICFQAFCMLIAAEEEVSSEMSHEEEEEETL